jgi:hypothetical protein
MVEIHQLLLLRVQPESTPARHWQPFWYLASASRSHMLATAPAIFHLPHPGLAEMHWLMNYHAMNWTLATLDCWLKPTEIERLRGKPEDMLRVSLLVLATYLVVMETTGENVSLATARMQLTLTREDQPRVKFIESR